MKLTEAYFFPTITNEGVEELYQYTKAILLKSGKQIPKEQWEDLQQDMVLRCLEKLPNYDQSKGIPLGGYLYWQCRGCISIHANRYGRELPYADPYLEWLKQRDQ